MPIQPAGIIGGQCKSGITWAGGAAAASSLLTDLAHYWTLNEGSGTRADSVGSVTLTDNNTVGSVAGINADAANFIRANSEFLSYSTPQSVMPADGLPWTIAFWIKATMVGAALVTDAMFGNKGFSLTATASGGQVTMAVGDGTTQISQNIGATASLLPAASSHLVVMWWDSADSKFACSIDNAAAVASSSTVAYKQPQGPGVFRIGGFGAATNGPDGWIDEYAIWSRVLTSGERTTLYNSGVGKFYPTF